MKFGQPAERIRAFQHPLPDSLLGEDQQFVLVGIESHNTVKPVILTPLVGVCQVVVRVMQRAR